MLNDGASVAFRADSPELFERGSDNVVRLYPSRAGVALTPTSATVTIRDRAGTVIVNAGVATCADGQAAYTLTAATTTSLLLGEGWTVTWTVLLAGETIPRVVSGDAALIRTRLYPVLADADVFGRVPALNPNAANCIHSYPTLEGFRVDAWQTLHERLVDLERRPWLAMSARSFREPHLLLTLSRIYADASRGTIAEYAQEALKYERQFERAWSRMQWVFDESESGLATGAPEPVQPSIWLGGSM